MEKTLGFSNFLTQVDPVGMSVLILLLALSVASWYLIVTKSIGNMIASRRAKVFLKHFWYSLGYLPRLDSDWGIRTGYTGQSGRSGR